MPDQRKISDKELKDWCANYTITADVLVVGMKIN